MVVRTSRKTNYEEKLKKKITTSGCAIGTVFGDVYDEILKNNKVFTDMGVQFFNIKDLQNG